jgi:hypothetical protein
MVIMRRFSALRAAPTRRANRLPRKKKTRPEKQARVQNSSDCNDCGVALPASTIREAMTPTTDRPVDGDPPQGFVESQVKRGIDTDSQIFYGST